MSLHWERLRKHTMSVWAFPSHRAIGKTWCLLELPPPASSSVATVASYRQVPTVQYGSYTAAIALDTVATTSRSVQR